MRTGPRPSSNSFRQFRKALMLLHRWAGLSLAAFLIVAGLTGALLAFYDELDTLLNPDWHRVVPSEQRMNIDAIAARVERAYPQGFVSLLPLATAPERSLRLRLNPRHDAAKDGRRH